MRSHAPESPLDDQLPPELRRHLRSLDERPVALRPDADAAIRDQIRAHIGRSRWHRVWRWPAGIAAAAAVVLAVVLIKSHQTPPDPGAQAAAAIENDFDGNGRVDVLDAFLVARHLETRVPLPAKFDVNRDGVVDHLDADRLASLAVSLTDD